MAILKGDFWEDPIMSWEHFIFFGQCGHLVSPDMQNADSHPVSSQRVMGAWSAVLGDNGLHC